MHKVHYPTFGNPLQINKKQVNTHVYILQMFTSELFIAIAQN